MSRQNLIDSRRKKVDLLDFFGNPGITRVRIEFILQLLQPLGAGKNRRHTSSKLLIESYFTISNGMLRPK